MNGGQLPPPEEAMASSSSGPPPPASRFRKPHPRQPATRYLFVGNCGPAVGVDTSSLDALFKPLGATEVLVPHPDASHVYVTFRDEHAAAQARLHLASPACGLAQTRHLIVKHADVKKEPQVRHRCSGSRGGVGIGVGGGAGAPPQAWEGGGAGFRVCVFTTKEPHVPRRPWGGRVQGLGGGAGLRGAGFRGVAARRGGVQGLGGRQLLRGGVQGLGGGGGQVVVKRISSKIGLSPPPAPCRAPTCAVHLQYTYVQHAPMTHAHSPPHPPLPTTPTTPHRYPSCHTTPHHATLLPTTHPPTPTLTTTPHTAPPPTHPPHHTDHTHPIAAHHTHPPLSSSPRPLPPPPLAPPQAPPAMQAALLSVEEVCVPGLYLLHDFVSPEEEGRLLAALELQPWVCLAKRRVQHYGYKFEYAVRGGMCVCVCGGGVGGGGQACVCVGGEIGRSQL